MCTYNGAKYISEQINSIINQTYPVHELIIQDDHSSDETWTILQQYANEYPYIHVFQNEKERGVNSNFFSAMERATGNYIAISDQDDIWEPDKLEQQAPYLQDFMLIAGITSSFADDNSVDVPFDGMAQNHHLERLIYTNAVAGHTMIFSKSLIEKIPDKTHWGQYYYYDHLLVLTATAHDSLMYLPIQLVRHRRLTDSLTYSKPISYEKNGMNAICYFFRTFQLFRTLRPEMRRHFKNMFLFLNAINTDSYARKNALQLSKLHAQNFFKSYIPLVLLCIRLKDKIFFRPEKNKVLAIARALYFPISCSDYFRFSKKTDSK